MSRQFIPSAFQRKRIPWTKQIAESKIQKELPETHILPRQLHTWYRHYNPTIHPFIFSHESAKWCVLCKQPQTQLMFSLLSNTIADKITQFQFNEKLRWKWSVDTRFVTYRLIQYTSHSIKNVLSVYWNTKKCRSNKLNNWIGDIMND
jgi:hypothetical protein